MDMPTVSIFDARIIPAESRDPLVAALAASKAPETRRAYRTAWTFWTDWAADHGHPAMSADSGHAASFLAARFAGGAGLSTLRMACAAIGEAHRLAGLPNPCAAPLVKTAMQGFARQAAETRTVKQARGLTSEAVAVIRAHLDLQPNREKAGKTMAIVSVVSDAGLRRSEAAALRWADIERESDDSGRVSIRRSKTDPTGSGAVVAITATAMADLDRLREFARPDESDSVFGLGDRQIANRIAAVAEACGLGAGFGGHSGRVGMALRMTRNGAPAATVMRQGRWSTTRMVARYTRNESAGEALRYL